MESGLNGNRSIRHRLLLSSALSPYRLANVNTDMQWNEESGHRTVTEQHAILLIHGAWTQRHRDARHAAYQLALNKISKRQTRPIKILNNSIQKLKLPVPARQVLRNNVLALYLIPLLLAPAVLFVRPSQSKSITLTNTLSFSAIET